MITEATKARFAREVAKYPADQKQSAVMACLSIVQQEQGYVSAESEAVIADYLGMAQIAVHEVTTFYNMYNQQPVGKYKLNVCTNLPCQLRDGQKALHHLEKKLGVSMGETTPMPTVRCFQMRFSVSRVSYSSTRLGNLAQKSSM